MACGYRWLYQVHTIVGYVGWTWQVDKFDDIFAGFDMVGHMTGGYGSWILLVDIICEYPKAGYGCWTWLVNVVIGDGISIRLLA